MMILQFLIEGGLLALCATLFGCIFLRKHPAARYTLLLAALFACLLLPMQMLLFKESGLALAHVNLPEGRLKPALQPLVPDGSLKAAPEPTIAVRMLKPELQPLAPEGRLKPALQPLIPNGSPKPIPQPPV